MDTFGFLYFEQATNQDGREYVHDPKCGQSTSLSHINSEVSTDDHVNWVNDDKIRFGRLTFDPKDENEVIKVQNGIGKMFDALSLVPTLQDLNSQLHDSYEQLQELENQKTVFLKEEARIQVEKLPVEDRCGALISGIVTLGKSLEKGKKDE
ncbi:hypothetical protein ACH5RR_001514 [Cinchona calisaya]|uniref:Uncharacterized protein n=1 Tax=Cinchona calisaya TaxID=153742 RepID=A0ABD3B3Q9_9GENT